MSKPRVNGMSMMTARRMTDGINAKITAILLTSDVHSNINDNRMTGPGSVIQRDTDSVSSLAAAVRDLCLK